MGEIKAVEPTEYKRLMRTPLVYDGRNIYGIEDMKLAGVEYYSIGRPYVKNNIKSLEDVAATID